MEANQNVTLSLPRHILRKVKILAIQKNTSLSGLLTQALADLVAHQEAYEQARQRSLDLLNDGLNFGTHGQASWKREDLHER
jgi:predicted transcriptional regulator